MYLDTTSILAHLIVPFDVELDTVACWEEPLELKISYNFHKKIKKLFLKYFWLNFYLIIGPFVEGRRNGDKFGLKGAFAKVWLAQHHMHGVSLQHFI